MENTEVWSSAGTQIVSMEDGILQMLKNIYQRKEKEEQVEEERKGKRKEAKVV